MNTSPEVSNAFNLDPATPRSPALRVWALTLMALWLLACVAGPDLMAASGLALNPHAHTHLYAHGHPFVDARVLWGVPNAMDVLSNAPLSLAGLWGLFTLRGLRLPAATQRAAQTFFVGLLCTGAGSAWYHWSPDAAGLVVDRMGMAMVFAGAWALAVAERLGQPSVPATLWLTALLAMVSAVLPLTHDNVLPWVVVQFGGMAMIVWAARQPPVAGAMGVRIGALIGWYALAKGLELGDEAVFYASSQWVSGHSLKHIVAAGAAVPVLQALRQQWLRQNAAGRRPIPLK